MTGEATSMLTAHSQRQLDAFAEELTRRLGIPFDATPREIVFRERLRITDWAVPLLFDGHAQREDDAIIPTDFIGHVLWPALRPYRQGRNRTWWYCALSPQAAGAILQTLREEDDYPLDEGGWVIGDDVVLDDGFRTRPSTTQRVA
jgi:hypothetical protein